MLETAPNADAQSALRHNQKGTEIVISRYAGSAAAGRA